MPVYNSVKSRFNSHELDPCLAAEVRIKKDLMYISNFRQSKCLLCIVLTLLTAVLLTSAFMMIFYSGYFSSSLSSVVGLNQHNRLGVSLADNSHIGSNIEKHVPLSKIPISTTSSAKETPTTRRIFFKDVYLRHTRPAHILHTFEPKVKPAHSVNLLILKNNITARGVYPHKILNTPKVVLTAEATTITVSTTTTTPLVLTFTNNVKNHNVMSPQLTQEIVSGDLVLESVLPAFPTFDALSSPISSGKQHCEELRRSGHVKSGVYNFSVPNFSDFPAFCLITADHGWTVLQRRTGPELYFWNNTFTEYENGFGNVYGDHWLGLEKLYSYSRRYYMLQLRIVLIGDFCTRKCSGFGDNGFWWGDWDFSMAGKSDFYKLNYLKFLQGNLSTINTVDYFAKMSEGQNFSTVDKDNSNLNKSAAAYRRKGAWWHNNHTFMSLNGLYGSTSHIGEGQSWYWTNGKGMTYNIKPKKSLIMFRIKE